LRKVEGWVMEDDDGFMWFDTPPEGYFDYGKKFYNATLTIDSELTLEKGEKNGRT